MKVAILGGGIRGIEAAVVFKQLGAEVCLISQNLGGVYSQFPQLALKAKWEQVASSDLRKNFSALEGSVDVFGNVWESYLKPLIEQYNLKDCWKQKEILRVQKSFLSLEAEVSGKSRMADTFRIIYQEDPYVTEDSLVKDKRLEESFESFVEADIVVEALGTWSNPKGSSPAGLALGEKDTNIVYGAKAFSELLTGVSEKRNLILGSGWMSFLAIQKLLPSLLKNTTEEILWACSQEDGFKSLLASDELFEDISSEEISAIPKVMQQWIKEQQDTFEIEMREWRNKGSLGEAPKEPIPPLQRLMGHGPLSFDHHTNQSGIFVTFERSPLLESSDGADSILTRVVDKVYCLTGHTRSISLFSHLRCRWKYCKKEAFDPSGTHPEPGFYSLWNSSQIDDIKQQAMSFFSRRDS